MPPVSVTPNAIVVAIPSGLVSGSVVVQVQSGGAASNPVLVAVQMASPGLFSAAGNGAGQGYILNQDGTLNSPANPAAPGDKITVYATGAGPVSFADGYAVTHSPVAAYIDGFYCDGVAAVMGSVAGFPGAVYQLTVYVPNFTFPPQVGVVLQIDGAASQKGLAISIAQ